MSFASKGKDLLRRRASARGPWNSPQSSSSLWPLTWSKCIEPVTVRAAPQKVTPGACTEEVGVVMRSLYSAGTKVGQAFQPDGQALSGWKADLRQPLSCRVISQGRE